MLRVKICGICSTEDAELCTRAGASALGFVCGVPTSVRSYVAPAEARAIIRRVPPYVSTVVVTTFSDEHSIEELLREVPASTVQLHGSISPESATRLRNRMPRLKVVKAIQVVDQASVVEAQFWQEYADALLLDSKAEGGMGGTGRTHDWMVSRAIVQAVRIPAILAGGLSPENVSEAVQTVQPFGVDVNSGVTNGFIKKDPTKVFKFVQRVLQAEVGRG
ncbi:MAG: phosphoribosylanthranilate isomerase [Acidobacteria bacterium]|nr:phosphoribosylanthranilate isomerase [Acidobacteriota bacterium]